MKGAAVSVARRVVPLKNSTRDSRPSGSVAVAVRLMVAGPLNDVPPVARLIVGGLLVAEVTVTLTATDVDVLDNTADASASDDDHGGGYYGVITSTATRICAACR